MNPSETRMLLVGIPEATHIGGHFLAAAAQLGVPTEFADARDAFRGAAWRRRLAWRALGHRPLRLRQFSRQVTNAAGASASRVVLATGLAPIDSRGLDELGRMGMARLNFLTDDPWNPVHHAPWFLEALSRYDLVFTPRHSNVTDLESLRGPKVRYLPFGYNDEQHYAPPPLDADDQARYGADLMFAGGADPERVSLLTALIEAGLNVALYGGYWERHRPTRGSARGHVDADGLRKAVAGASISLCLVRRANRDGNSMRTFEVPAMGGCLLMERTPDHETLFGPDGDAVVYFDGPSDAIDRARHLLAHPAERSRLAARARDLIARGAHTYRDRLTVMLEAAAGLRT
jgi:hypothetical protein